jgi:hypothetical protein
LLLSFILIKVIHFITDESEPTPLPNECFIKRNKLLNENKIKEMLVSPKKTAYFKKGWREVLCKCDECLKLYNKNGIQYLILPTDTIEYYEERGKEANPAIDENKLINEQLSSMDHVSKVEFLHNVSNFKDELKDFFISFAEKGQVIKRENVAEFFDNLNEKKRRKVNENSLASNYF